MFFGDDRMQLRQRYVDAWRKARAGQPLEPLEHLIAAVVEAHPEYQPELEHEAAALTAEYHPEAGATNPFLHMGLHLAVREQIATDRPPGISEVFSALCKKTLDPHEAEHAILDCLAETLWESQRQAVAPDERAYLARLRRLLDQSTSL